MNETINIRQYASYIFLTILETGQKYGAEMISKIISGEIGENQDNKKIKKLVFWKHSEDMKASHIKSIIYELINLHYIDRNEEHKSLYLTGKAVQFILDPQAILIEKEVIEPPMFSKELYETHETTYILLESGLSPEEIAEKRNLSVNTIYNHIAHLVFHKKIEDIRSYVDEECEKIIQEKMESMPENKENIYAIKKTLPKNISYNDIKITLAKNLQTA